MKNQTRREFLKQAATLASVTILSRSVFGANERIGVAVVGCGGMGNAHISTLLSLKQQGEPVDIVAVCDVWQKRLDAAAQRTGAKPVSDYRRILDDKNVDAVCIATPDHWHTKIAVDAMEAGKDVYCEKPMTHWKSLDEPKRIVSTLNRTKRVLQVGTQGMSDSIWEQVAELIKAGEIGTLIQAQAADMRTGHWSQQSHHCGIETESIWIGTCGLATEQSHHCGIESAKKSKELAALPLKSTGAISSTASKLGNNREVTPNSATM
jgi:siroheme synthase (precorrin-2 oxidase/ferrochelatase)